MTGSTLIATDWSVGVVIPARDESTTLAHCLQSVFAALDFASIDDAWIVVVADDCRDNTAEIAKALLGNRGEVIESSARSAGRSRRRGVQAALRHFAERIPSRVWLANTDADSQVPPDWISQHLQCANRGYVGVAGIVEVKDLQGYSPEQVSDLLDYRIEADGTHLHVHGANLGVRSDAYSHVGGWPLLDVAEDHGLWSRLREGGWTLMSSATSVVTTSGRIKGRATGGFADLLERKLRSIACNPDPACLT